MTGQGFLQMIDLQRADSMALEAKKSYGSGRSGNQDFKRILDEASGRNSRPGNVAKTNERAMEANRDAEKPQTSQKGIRSFREAVRLVNAKQKGIRPAGIESGHKALEELDSATSGKAGAVAEGLAQLLGMNGVDFVRLLEYLEINPEDLANGEQASEIAGKLAELAGLDSGQEKVLADLIRMVCKVVGEYADEAVNGTEEAEPVAVRQGLESLQKKGGVPAENARYLAASETDGMSGLVEEISRKLPEVLRKLQAEPRKSLEEIAAQMKAVMEQKGFIKADSAQENTVNGQVGIDDNAAENAGETTTGVSKERGDMEAESESVKSAVYASQQNRPAADGLNADNSPAVNGYAVHQQEPRTSIPDEAVPVSQARYITADEVINQVIGKARVILTGDKSEMILQLKPESLGKLSLKVVTENGIVMARFVAESQQVKQILESNMHILKDALEEQGLVVQDFSVSVGHDTADGFDRRSAFEKAAKFRTKAANNAAGNTAYSGSAEEIAAKIITYGWSDRKIDLTA